MRYLIIEIIELVINIINVFINFFNNNVIGWSGT